MPQHEPPPLTHLYSARGSGPYFSQPKEELERQYLAIKVSDKQHGDASLNMKEENLTNFVATLRKDSPT